MLQIYIQTKVKRKTLEYSRIDFVLNILFNSGKSVTVMQSVKQLHRNTRPRNSQLDGVNTLSADFIFTKLDKHILFHKELCLLKT